jgi:hypothetical protein
VTSIEEQGLLLPPNAGQLFTGHHPRGHGADRKRADYTRASASSFGGAHISFPVCETLTCILLARCYRGSKRALTN